jgi:hypothetical protein
VLEPRSQDASQHDSQNDMDPIQYPTNHVVAILDSSVQTACAVDGLLDGGFLDPEINFIRPEEVDRLSTGTGHRGVLDWFVRVTQSVGLKDDEMEMKEGYEQALRQGRTVIAVLTETEERKDRAAKIIRECGGHFINFFGRLKLERIAR